MSLHTIANSERMPPCPAPAARPLVELIGITKSFGATLANSGIDLAVRAGDVIGLVGGNGAGKSTLMRILSGATEPSVGAIHFAGEDVPLQSYGTAEAQRRGIRMVHQELSLCTNLSVAENFFLESPEAAKPLPGWRAAYRTRARAALDAAFPGNRIDPNIAVGRLSLGERQMVEIARAVATPGVRLIVLDEPTSSLDGERSRQLRAFVRERAAGGLAFIFISHKLQEVLDIATEAVVLRNGRLAWRGRAGEASISRLVQLMGGSAEALSKHAGAAAGPGAADAVRIAGAFTARLGREIALGRGEIVGLAGLEGSGQKELLHALFDPAHPRARDVRRTAHASFIAGDRQKEGVFPLWSVLDNIAIGRIARRPSLGAVDRRAEREAARRPAATLRLEEARFESNILDLSGGNQQKALVARALAADAPILLLDDPTRGVDVATKQDFYRLCAEIAQAGRTLVWQSTEDAELLACDRVLVFSGGEIVAELSGDELDEESIVAASFTDAGERPAGAANDRQARGLLARIVDAAPFLGLALVASVMIWANPLVASVFGADLLLLPALSLVLVTVAQMFIVGGSEIDLGVGAFAALISVLCATLLAEQPTIGWAAIVAALAAYAAMGALIQARRIPAIVVTLGASFVWFGLGYSMQPTPGGVSPPWLSALVNWSVGFLPTSIILIALVAALAFVIDRMPLGVALRGFGNNPQAMLRSGWSPNRYGVVRYLVAGLFAAAAGFSLTAINTASDINSGSSFTLLSVAAVVMGGCALVGGVIAPLGAVVGAVTLSLIGALLGVLGVSSEFNAAAQGLVLILLLALRSLTADEADQT